MDSSQPFSTIYDAIIIGAGPAGLTAGIYATRANLKTLIVAGGKWGGQLMLTTDVENFPGFPEGIMGPDLMIAMRKQAERFGAEILESDFESADLSKSPKEIIIGGKKHVGKTIIIATGADTLWLGVKGEKEKIGRGVSSCAPCDAAFFRGKNVIVVGGGDSAMEEAIFLTKFANQVTIVHRRDKFRASQIMLKRAKNNPKIAFLLNTVVTEVLGENKVTGVKVMSKTDSKESEMLLDGVFVAIGHVPNSKLFPGIDTDEKGFIKKYDHFMTSVEGVFVAGDVHDHEYKQAVTAAGFGCSAALEVERYLQSHPS